MDPILGIGTLTWCERAAVAVGDSQNLPPDPYGFGTLTEIFVMIGSSDFFTVDLILGIGTLI